MKRMLLILITLMTTNIYSSKSSGLKHNTTKTYTNGGKDVTELTVPDWAEEYRPARETDFSRKVLEYYLEHKSEMEINMENK